MSSSGVNCIYKLIAALTKTVTFTKFDKVTRSHFTEFGTNHNLNQ